MSHFQVFQLAAEIALLLVLFSFLQNKIRLHVNRKKYKDSEEEFPNQREKIEVSKDFLISQNIQIEKAIELLNNNRVADASIIINQVKENNEPLIMFYD